MALVNEINRHRRDFGIGCSGLLKRVHNIVLYTGEAGIFIPAPCIIDGGDLCAKCTGYCRCRQTVRAACRLSSVLYITGSVLKQPVDHFISVFYQYSGFLSVCLTVQQPLSRILSAVIEQIWNRIGDMGTAADWRRMIRHN